MPPTRTSTSSFGTSRREGHDASNFYARYPPPVISADETINQPRVVDQFVHGDARTMSAVADSSVALVVTSPPYLVGRDYERDVGRGLVPGSYVEYLGLLRDVLADCVRVLEPGGRIAVNVANLGRKPYRSLAADVLRIFQKDLGLLLRGEIVWVKAAGAGSSCAWGSFASASNPVLRDLTERVLVACKGRFDRAVSRAERQRLGLPFENTISKKWFMEATLDVWRIQSERATRIGHPAPFPVDLPRRLIELYTYRGDLVLDPFVGSGTTAVAAVRTDRRYVGYDTEASYLDLARARLDHELQRARGRAPSSAQP